MLTTYFKSASTIARYRAGGAGPHLDLFVAWLAEKGYRRVSIRRHVREVAYFAAWAGSVGFGTAPPWPCCPDATARLPCGARTPELPK